MQDIFYSFRFRNFFDSKIWSDFFLELYLPLPLYPQKFIENHIISMENGVEMGPGGHLGTKNSQEEKSATNRLDLVWIWPRLGSILATFLNNCSQFLLLFSRCFGWGAPGRFFGGLLVFGVTFGGHFRWYFWKVCVFFGKGGTIDFERPYNDFAVFWSSAASRKAAKMRIHAYGIILFF